MIINPNLPTGFVIFCDDVREEVSGKQTFVGTYGPEMTVFGTAPAVIQSLAVVVRYREDPKNLPRNIIFRIFKAVGSETSLLMEVAVDAPALPDQFEFPESDEPEQLRIVDLGFSAKLPPVEVSGNFVIRVRAFSGDDEIRLGSLNVKLASPPTL